MNVFSRMLCLLSMLLVAHASTAQENKPNARTISVQGRSIVEVAPDMVVLGIALKSDNRSSDKVVDEHFTLLGKFKEVLAAEQIAAGDFQTSNMGFGEHWEFEGQVRTFKGYVATTEISVTVKDLKKYVPLWKALAKTTGVSIERIQFEHSNRIAYQEEARESALKAAKKKAEAMAAVLNCKLGNPTFISENNPIELEYYGRVPAAFNNVAARSGEEITGTGGKLKIKGDVNVTFELMSN